MVQTTYADLAGQLPPDALGLEKASEPRFDLRTADSAGIFGPDPCNNALLVELRPILHIHLHPQISKRFHLCFHLGRVNHSERVK